MDWPLLIAITAIAVTLLSAKSSSVRNEAHHQVSKIQEILKSLSDLENSHLDEYYSQLSGNAGSQASASVFEAKCSVSCDLLESAVDLLRRRCSRYLLFDANSDIFHNDFINKLGDLRNSMSAAAYVSGKEEMERKKANLKINAEIVKLYVDLNIYIGERFRPIFESRLD